jgi:hypothetical protein
MSNYSTAVTVANEIVKAVDFTYAHDQAIDNIVITMKSILANESLDLVIGGKVIPYEFGGMNVSIEPVFAHCGNTGIDVVETELRQPVSIEISDQNQDRIDIIQVRGAEELYDVQYRKFRDPNTGIETTQEIATKKRIMLEIAVKKGVNGSVTAPAADIGYVKLAEIVVLAGEVAITADNVKNITGRYAGAINFGWTNENTRTFNPGYLTDIIGKFLIDHTDTGTHKSNVINAAMIKFGNESNDVNGGIIPIGLSLEIMGQNYTAMSALAQVMMALAAAINLAYPYANNILSKYMLIAATPGAASTANIDVVTGGTKSIDGITCPVGQMVFLKNQTDPKQNGLWEVQTGQWNRYTGYTGSVCFTNKFILIKTGTVNAGKVFYLESDDYVVGTDPLIFRESMFSPKNLAGKALIRDHDGGIDDPVNPKDVTNMRWVKDYISNQYFHVGKMIEQYPDEPSPVEKGWPGSWAIWSARAVLYGLSTSAPPASVDYYSLVDTSIAAGSTPVVNYHKAGDDFRLYKFISRTSAYTVPAELDPLKWTYLAPEVIVERTKCGNALTQTDRKIGQTVASGTYAGRYVTEVIVPGGKFAGVEGGFRPTFISGGAQQDTIRDIWGNYASPADGFPVDGAFTVGTTGTQNYSSALASVIVGKIGFSAARVVKTGPQVQPVHFSTRIWRRTS